MCQGEKCGQEGADKERLKRIFPTPIWKGKGVKTYSIGVLARGEEGEIRTLRDNRETSGKERSNHIREKDLPNRA